MCKIIMIDGKGAANMGALIKLIGHVPILDGRDDFTNNSCLCSVDIEKLADRFDLFEHDGDPSEVFFLSK